MHRIIALDHETGGTPVPTLYHLLQTWAERTPHAPALLAPGRRPLSYQRIHITILKEPYVRTLAEHLKACLARARANSAADARPAAQTSPYLLAEAQATARA
jgi:hypothetical protein